MKIKLKILSFTFIFVSISCSGSQNKSEQTVQTNPDFDPNEAHLYTKMIDESNASIENLCNMKIVKDSIFADICILDFEIDSFSQILRELDYLQDGHNGRIECSYNEFNELTEYKELSDNETRLVKLEWNEDGNISNISLTVKNDSVLLRSESEIVTFTRCAFSNWYGSLPRIIAGHLFQLFYTGTMGRAPWMVCREVKTVRSFVEDGIIVSQDWGSICPEYQFDSNGLVVVESYEDYRYAYSYLE